MKYLFNTIKWKFSDYEPKKEILLFNNFINIGSHFKGVKSYCIELIFSGGVIIFSINGITKLGEDFKPIIKKYGSLNSLKIRLGSPLITIHFNTESRDKSINAILKYKI